MNDFQFQTIDTSAIMRGIETIKVDTPVQHMWADEQFDILKKYFKTLKNR